MDAHEHSKFFSCFSTNALFLLYLWCVLAQKNNFTELLTNKFRTLLIPAISFILLSWVLFHIKGYNDFIQSNILWKLDSAIKGSITWFLIALFIFNIIEYWVRKLNIRKIELIASIIVYPLGGYLYAKNYFSIIPIIPVAHILVFWIYFVIGSFWGRKIISIIDENNRKSNVLAILGSITIVLIHIIPWNYGIFSNISFYLYIFPYTLFLIYLLLYVCNKFKEKQVLSFFSYVGCNSIIVYLVHWPLWIYVVRNYQNSVNIYLLYFAMVFMLVISIFVINRYIPFIIGGKYKHN